ncbi:MAG TPA: tetratricopeptide repeat protein [Bryobacteraceae bacterium]
MRSLREITAVSVAVLALVSCNRDPKVVARGYVATGDKYYEKGKYREARLMYMRAKQKDLRFGDAYYKWGLAELKLGSFGAAVGAFQRAIELIPPSRQERWDSIVKISDIYLVAAHQERDQHNQQQYLDDVEHWCGELLKHDPNSYDGHRLTGDLYLGKSIIESQRAEKDAAAKFLEQAIAEYHKADSINPGQVGILMQLARTSVSKNDLAGAEQLYRQAIDKDKTNQPAYTELYRLYWAEKKQAEGEQLLKLAFQNTKQVIYLTTLATQYAVQSRKPEMVSTLDQVKANFQSYPDAYVTVGDFYYRQGDNEAALREYREGIAKDPKRKTTYEKHMIEVMLHEGRAAEAIALNSQILKEDPKDPDSRGLAATVLLEKGEIAKAITDLQTLVTSAPDNPVARYNLGRAYAARGDWEQARQAYQKATEIKPDYLLPRLALAKLQFSRAEYEAAQKSAETILNTFDRNNATAQLILTASLIGQKKFPEARNLLDYLVKAKPSSPEVYLQLGVLNLAEKKYKESETAFRKAYDLNPADTRGLIGVVQCNLVQNRGDQAVQLLQTESDKSPNRKDLRIALANAELDNGKYDQAIAGYQQVLSSPDGNVKQRAGVYLRLGEAYRRKGDHSSAIANMQKARESQPDDSAVLTNLALTFDEAGRTSESRQVYEAALKLDPNNGLILNNLAFQMAEHGGDLNEALTKALKAKQLLPNLLEVSDTIGWIYLKKGLNDNAVDIFKDLVNKVPGQATYRYHLGMALNNKGDKAQAARELRESLKYNPSKEEREKIQELLGRLGGSGA